MEELLELHIFFRLLKSSALFILPRKCNHEIRGSNDAFVSCYTMGDVHLVPLLLPVGAIGKVAGRLS